MHSLQRSNCGCTEISAGFPPSVNQDYSPTQVLGGIDENNTHRSFRILLLSFRHMPGFLFRPGSQWCFSDRMNPLLLPGNSEFTERLIVLYNFLNSAAVTSYRSAGSPAQLVCYRLFGI